VSDLDCASIGRLFQTTPLMINDNIASYIAYFLHKSHDFSFRQLPPGWPPIPLLARSLFRLPRRCQVQNATYDELNDGKVRSFRISLKEKFNSILPSLGGHLITLSARANTFGGIVTPICFAAFKLITNSNFVACCTGKSAGLAPFKILST
jgi:hypothetical protein